jgi:hypothetical protein
VWKIVFKPGAAVFHPTFDMSSRLYREHQQEYRDTHARRGNHAAHYLSVMELKHFRVSKRHFTDGPANYRMVSADTNLRVHTSIDNELLSAFCDRREIDIVSVDGRSVPLQAVCDRVFMKIDAAKATGAIQNMGVHSYLRWCAEKLNLDLRAFNGLPSVFIGDDSEESDDSDESDDSEYTDDESDSEDSD